MSLVSYLLPVSRWPACPTPSHPIPSSPPSSLYCCCWLQDAASRVSHITASAADAHELTQALADSYPAAAAAAAGGPDVLVVDPPRKGLDPAVLQLLTDGSSSSSSSGEGSSGDGSSGGSSSVLSSVRRLVYLSCGFDALRADTDALLGAGWRLAGADGFLFFPGTDTIETLAVFERG